MHAYAPTVPLSAARDALLRPDRALPAQDPFKTVFQGRLVAHLKRAAITPSVSERPKTPALSGGELRRGGKGRGWSVISRPGEESGNGQAGPEAWRVPPDSLPEAAALLLQAGFPPEPLQRLLADPRVQQEGLGREDLRRVWEEAQAAASANSLDDAGAGPRQAFESGVPLPPPLAGLLDLVERSPGEILPVPASRQPEMAALLSDAGFTPAQVESLLASPQVQEHGLSAAVLRAAWLKTVQDLQARANDRFMPGPERQVTSRTDYQRLWERLHLPAEAMPDLRLALQQLGASPEALAGLEEYATPQAIPVGQVWQVIKQCLSQGLPTASQAGGAEAAEQALPSSPPSAAEIERWRQLLVQAGFSPEMVDGLLSIQPPASAQELRARLAALAPAVEPAETRDTPKPLYMPETLRLRSSGWKNQDAPGPDGGERESGRTLLANPEKSGLSPSLAGDSQGTFSALFAPAVTPLHASSPNNGEGVPGPWSPQMRHAFWSQLVTGILGNLKPGESRLNLMLNPPHLGLIELRLNLHGEALAVTAMITRPEVAHLAGAGVEQLVQALSRHGLVLSQFQVQVPAVALEPARSMAAEQKMMDKKEQETGGGVSARRRRASRVDRFI